MIRTGLASAVALAALAARGPKGPAAAPLPPPAATLSVDAPDAAGPWKLAVANAGSVNLRVAADARLLVLEVTPAGGGASVTCRLPPSMRPGGVVEERGVVLRPGQRYEEPFDPALYCFARAAAAAVAPGARVVARLGWPPPAKPKWARVPPARNGPWVVEPAQIEPTVAAVEEIVAPAVVVGGSTSTSTSSPSPSPSPGPSSTTTTTTTSSATSTGITTSSAGVAGVATNGSVGGRAPSLGVAPPPTSNADLDPRAPRLAVSGPARVDAASSTSISIDAVVENAGRRPAVAFLRHDSVAFEVDGPTGHAACGATPARQGAARDFFTTLRPGAKHTVRVLLSELCPRPTFRRPGLYVVRPVLRIRETGDRWQIAAWSGTSRPPATTLVRVQTAPLPFHDRPPYAEPAEPAAAAP